MKDIDEVKLNRRIAVQVLKKAKEVNKDHTVPVVVDAHTTVYITPAQAADKKFMERFWKLRAKPIIKTK